jgi:hypothetical protein
MNDENLYYNVVQSLVKFIQDFREEVQPNSGYFDFDAHAQQSELPAGILMGPAGTALTYVGGLQLRHHHRSGPQPVPAAPHGVHAAWSFEA